MSAQDDSLRPDLTTELRVKVPLPLVIPLVALAVIGIVAWGFAQILLAVPKEAATMLAMVAAANVFGAFAYAALRPRMQPVTMAELAVIVLYPVIIGLAIAQFDFGAGAEHGHDTAAAETSGAGAAAEGGAPAGPTEAVTSTGLQFDVETIVLEANKPASIEFTNEDSAPHNIAIYEDDTASEAIFEGEQITASSTTYEFDAPKPGEYYFQCDVHPDMNGDVISQ